MQKRIAKIRKKYNNDGGEEEIKLMIKLTKRAEKLGFKVKDKLYLEDGRYFGKIFRVFTMNQINTFMNDSKKDQYAEIFIEANKGIDKGVVRGEIIDGKVVWGD